MLKKQQSHPSQSKLVQVNSLNQFTKNFFKLFLQYVWNVSLDSSLVWNAMLHVNENMFTFQVIHDIF